MTCQSLALPHDIYAAAARQMQTRVGSEERKRVTGDRNVVRTVPVKQAAR